MRVFRACPAPDSRLSAARRGQVPGLLEIQIPLLSGRKNPMRPSLARTVSKTFADSGISANYLRGFAELAAELTAAE
jgi:hypothetical protein